MKLQLSLITIGIAACNLVDLAYASPMSSPDSAVLRKTPGLLRRGLSEWGIGSYGGTVSEISVVLAEELENSAAAVESNESEIASPTITSAPTSALPTAETTALNSTTEIDSTTSTTSWTTTMVTETVYVTIPPPAMNTAVPTETPATPERKVKRDEVPLQFDELESDQFIMEMNQPLPMDTADPCIPAVESGNKICIEDKVATCGARSGIWKSISAVALSNSNRVAALLRRYTSFMVVGR